MRTAAYARYSSDAQREASLEDQLRNCRARCAAEGWPDPTVYTDAAISGARGDRPGYRALLAEAHGFDVILVDDLSRLSRDKEDCGKAVKRLVFAGVRLVGVSDGVDTARKSHKADVGLRGLMSELYLDDLAEKTHRGLTGRALAGASAGGLPYGYRVTEVGQRAVDEAQAAIVRRIYADYLAGQSPRSIAAVLNAEGVPAPRGGTWGMSAIREDAKRGLGIIGNPVYIGRWVWNRSRWVKHPETGRRVRQERPRAEWITRDHPELAIVDVDTWHAAQARSQSQRAPRSPERRGGPGRPCRHLLSGLLRCGTCGGAIVAVDRRNYGCGRNKDRGDAVCTSRLRVCRADVEAALLAGVQSQLLSDAAFERFQRGVAAAMKASAPRLDVLKRTLVDAERVRTNILAALRAGIITPSTRAELLTAEAAVDAAQAELERARTSQPAQLLPRAREKWRAIVGTLTDSTAKAPAARAALRSLIGEDIRLATNENGAIYCEIAPSSIKLVAGAGFEPATFGL